MSLWGIISYYDEEYCIIGVDFFEVDDIDPIIEAAERVEMPELLAGMS